MKVSFGNMAHSMGKGMHMGHGAVGGHFHVVHHAHNVHHINVSPRPKFKSNFTRPKFKPSFGSRAGSQQFKRGMNQGFGQRAARAKAYHNTFQTGNKTNVGQYVSQMIKHDNKIKSMQKAKDQHQQSQDQQGSRDPNKKSLLQQMIDAIDDVGQHMQRAQEWQGPQR